MTQHPEWEKQIATLQGAAKGLPLHGLEFVDTLDNARQVWGRFTPK